MRAEEIFHVSFLSFLPSCEINSGTESLETRLSSLLPCLDTRLSSLLPCLDTLLMLLTRCELRNQDQDDVQSRTRCELKNPQEDDLQSRQTHWATKTFSEVKVAWYHMQISHVSFLRFLQSCEINSGTESLETRLSSLLPCLDTGLSSLLPCLDTRLSSLLPLPGSNAKL